MEVKKRSNIEVPLGRTITVSYEGDFRSFNHWDAPGTSIDGYGGIQAEFVLVPATGANSTPTVKADVDEPITVNIPTSDIATITVTPEDNRVTISGNTITGPSKALVELDYEITNPDYKQHGWKFVKPQGVPLGSTFVTAEKPVTCKLGYVSCAEPTTILDLSETKSETTYDTATHTASMDGSGGVFFGGGFLAPISGHLTVWYESGTDDLPGASVVFFPDPNLQVSHVVDINTGDVYGNPSLNMIEDLNTRSVCFGLDSTGFPPMNIEAKTVERPQLEVELTCMDDSSVNKGELGYVKVIYKGINEGINGDSHLY